MNPPDLREFTSLNRRNKRMEIPTDHSGSFPGPSRKPRAFVLLKSGRRLDLLNPDPNAWTDGDLAIGLSRTYRWGGHSAWDLPLSVAQHSLTVLALREAAGPLAPAEALRELLHDATEALMGGWDCIAPLKPHLGAEFDILDGRLQAAVDQRYQLPPWTEADYRRHKHADRLAAASEAFHVVGWSLDDMRSSLEIALAPLDEDPLHPPDGMSPWEPWPPRLAAQMFHIRLGQLLGAAASAQTIARLARAFALLPPDMRRRCNAPPTGDSLKDALVRIEADDGSMTVEGVIVDGERDENGDIELDAEFTVFTTDDKPSGELIRVFGWNCHVEIL